MEAPGPPAPPPAKAPLVTFSKEKNIFMSFRFSKFTLIYIHSRSAYVKNRGTGIPMPCLCGTDFWKSAFSLWLGWTSTESHRKEMHRTRNVRGSGVSVVPRTDLKTEGKQPNNRETGYREYRFKRNSRRNEENELVWSHDAIWIKLKVWFCGLGSWFAFVLFNLSG